MRLAAPFINLNLCQKIDITQRVFQCTIIKMWNLIRLTILVKVPICIKQQVTARRGELL